MKRGFTLVEVLVATGIIVLVGAYLGSLALSSREVVVQGQHQTEAAQILARLGSEAQRGNPQVVPAGTLRELDAVALTGFLGRDATGYRAEVRAADNPSGLRDYTLQVCWADGCMEGSVRGPAPIAGAGGTPPGRVEVGQGVLEVLVEGQVTPPPDVHVTGGGVSHRVQQWGMTRLERLPSGSYNVTALSIQDDRFTYEAASITGIALGAGQGSRVVVRYQPSSGAIHITVTAPPGAAVNATLSGPGGAHVVRESVLIPFLAPGTYTLAAPDIPCGDFVCTARIEGSPTTLAAGQTQSMTLAYGYASGHLRVNIAGVTTGDVVVRGPAGFERTVTGSTTLRDLAPGTYTLSPREVRYGGFTWRAQEGSATVVAGQTGEAIVTYTPVTGRLRVEVVSEHDGVLGRVLRGTQALHSFGRAGGEWELSPERYTVQPISYNRGDFRYEAVEQQVDVLPGQTSLVRLVFARATAVLEYEVSGLPQGTPARATLHGPGGSVQNLPVSQRITGLAPGQYEFRAEAVEAGGFTFLPSPATRTLNLMAGQRHALAVVYTRQEGSVYLAVSGQPVGTSPAIRLQRGGASFPLSPGPNSSLPTGSFTVQADPITHGGFTYLPAASPASFTLAHGQTQRVEVHYTRQAGTLNLVLDGLSSAPMRLSGPMNKSLTTGGSYSLLPGDYVLSADPVDQGGFRYTPTIEGGSFTLAVGQTHTATVRYARSTARLEVRVTGVNGPTPMTLSGPTSRTLDSSTILDFLAPGAYTLTPHDVTRDRPTPVGTGRFTYRAAPISLSLAAGQTGLAEVRYVRQQGGLTVAVTGLPAGATPSLRLVGGGLDHRFAGGSLSPLPTGSYTLTPEPVRHGSYTFRATAQSFTLAHGEHRSLSVAYAPATGALRVNLSGPEGMPTPSARVWLGGTLVATVGPGTLLEDILPGEYRIEPLTVRDAAGFDYLAPEQRVTVVAGQTATASAVYVKQSGFIELRVTGAPPVSYSLVLRGPRDYTFTGPGRFEIVSGSYTATASNLNHGGFVYRATVNPGSFSLAPGQTVVIDLVYTRVAGQFRFNVSGLPGEARAPFSLAGPSNHSGTLGNGTTTTPDLLPGNYTLSTPDFAANGFTWRASGNAGHYSLAEGQTVAVNLSYAAITGRVQVNVLGVPAGATPALRIVQGGAVLHNFSSSAGFELVPGSYTVQADNLSHNGMTWIPSGQGSVTVTAGQVATVTVTFAPTTGRLRIITTGLPFAPGYGVTGPQSLHVSQADQTFDNVTPGEYTAHPNNRYRDAGHGIQYRYLPGRDLAGSSSYTLSTRDGFPTGWNWTPVGPNTPVGVFACIDNRAAHPAQVGFMEGPFPGGTANHQWEWRGSGWPGGLWVYPGQSRCISTVIHTSNRADLRLVPWIQINGPHGSVGGSATFSQIRVAPLHSTFRATVTAGELANLHVHYASTGSAVLQINAAPGVPVDVTFNGVHFTRPGRHVVNFLWPGNHTIQARATQRHGITFTPQGPSSVQVRSGEASEVVITYVPEHRAVLNLSIRREHYHVHWRFTYHHPPTTALLRNGAWVWEGGLGQHNNINLVPTNNYSLNRYVGQVHTVLDDGWNRVSWRVHSITGLPLTAQAGEVYTGELVWRPHQVCWRERVCWWWFCWYERRCHNF